LKTNEIVTITKDEFDKNDLYVGHTYGTKQTEESNKKRSKKLKGIPRPRKVFGECMYCGKYMDKANLERWHNDN